jgi:hypothetical protein
MNQMRNNSLLLFTAVTSILLVVFTHASLGNRSSFTPEEVILLQQIAENVKTLQPFLPKHKYSEYAVGIYKAARRYQIDPNLLVAIAHKESSFRNIHPVGRAGEVGLCQIRKMWIRNKNFRKEFPKAKVPDLRKPERTFLFAAWILHQLREKQPPDSLPYWSYYNSRILRYRRLYTNGINRHLTKINAPWNRDKAIPTLLTTANSGPFFQPEG